MRRNKNVPVTFFIILKVSYLINSKYFIKHLHVLLLQEGTFRSRHKKSSHYHISLWALKFEYTPKGTIEVISHRKTHKGTHTVYSTTAPTVFYSKISPKNNDLCSFVSQTVQLIRKHCPTGGSSSLQHHFTRPPLILSSTCHSLTSRVIV